MGYDVQLAKPLHKQEQTKGRLYQREFNLHLTK